MAVQRDLEVKMIAVLYARYHRGMTPLTKAGFRKVIQEQWSASDYRFDDAFENLGHWKYLKMEKVDGSEERFRLSPHGVDWFEGWFWLEDQGSTTFNYSPRHSGKIIVDQLRRDVERDEKAKKQTLSIHSPQWTKWGAIAALLALPLPFIIWWLS